MSILCYDSIRCEPKFNYIYNIILAFVTCIILLIIIQQFKTNSKMSTKEIGSTQKNCAQLRCIPWRTNVALRPAGRRSKRSMANTPSSRAGIGRSRKIAFSRSAFCLAFVGTEMTYKYYNNVLKEAEQPQPTGH